MCYLTIAALALALGLLGRRYLQLKAGVTLLAESVRRRRPFLEEKPHLRHLHPSWSVLAAATSGLITEHLRLSGQQADQLTQLETTLGNLREAVLIVNRDNYILLANRALRSMFPSAGELPGLRVESVLRSAEFLDYLESVRSSRSTDQKVIEFPSEGRSVWLETTGALVPDTDRRKGPWVLFVLHDVTRQRHLENVRKEFVANVSHELKTPLSVIKGYAETIVDEHRELPPEQLQEFASAIHRHSERLTAIVDDLLTLSTLEDPSAVAANFETVSIRALLESIGADFRASVQGGGHPFALQLPRQDAAARVDPRRIHQVFANLIENSCKYTPTGTPIEIGGMVWGGFVELWVRDEGPGIPAGDLPRIFERFYRVEKGRSREKGGTGLGLSIVKHIVQIHQGQVWAQSRLGEGLSIRFTLPALSEQPAGGVEDMPAPRETGGPGG